MVDKFRNPYAGATAETTPPDVPALVAGAIKDEAGNSVGGGSTTPGAGSVTAEMLAPSLAGQIAVTLPGTYSTDAARRAAVEADGRPDGTLYLVDDGA